MKRFFPLLLLIPFLCQAQDFKMFENLANKQYGLDVSIESKSKNLRKFGLNSDIDNGVEELIWEYGGIETLPTTNSITHFASSSASDTQDILIEGHTIDEDGDLTFVTQTVTLNGQTKTALTTPLARSSRMFNTNGTNITGTVYVSEDVTYTAGVPASGVHITMNGDNNQSLKAATSISKDDVWFIESVTLGVSRNVTASVDFKFQFRLKGGVWRTGAYIGVHSYSTPFEKILSTPIIIPPNTDVRLLATSSTNNTGVTAVIDGYLATIRN